MRYEKHIFICANQKDPGKACCGEVHGLSLVARFREVIEERGLKGKVRAQKSGCLDACKHGPSLVIYPDGTYYGKVGIGDVERIVDSHVINGETINELEINWNADEK